MNFMKSTPMKKLRKKKLPRKMKMTKKIIGAAGD